MAKGIKDIIIQSKIRQARLKAIKKLIQGIPVKPSFEYYDDEHTVAYERGQADLANQLRKILNTDPFAGREAYRPGNTANGPKAATPQVLATPQPTPSAWSDDINLPPANFA